MNDFYPTTCYVCSDMSKSEYGIEEPHSAHCSPLEFTCVCCERTYYKVGQETDGWHGYPREAAYCDTCNLTDCTPPFPFHDSGECTKHRSTLEAYSPPFPALILTTKANLPF